MDVTTPWRLISKDERIKANYKLDKYFAITGETQEVLRGRWQEASFGCLHESIAKAFPELDPFIRWHLVSADGTPMHYVANAMYWLGIANHAIYAMELPSIAFELFRKTVVFGAVEGDEIPSYKQGKDWLLRRLPALQEAFKQDMTKLQALVIK